MRIRTLLTAAALASAVAAPALVAPAATAATTTQLRVADSYTYQAGNPFDHTVCLDGTSLTSLSTTETTGPFTVTTGTHLLTVFSDLDASCAGNPELSTNIDLPEVAASTLLLTWPPNEGLSATVLADDLTCTQPGQGRLVVRHAATFYTETAADPIDLAALAPGDVDPTTYIVGLTGGHQASVDLAAGTYDEVGEYESGTTDLVMEDDAITIAEGTVTVRTLYGGNDGNTGSFDNTIEAGVCQDETTTTTTVAPGSTTTTTSIAPTNARPATPVSATPRYTG